MDQLHAISFGDVLREHRRSSPQKIAAVCGNTRLSYAALDERVNRLANALRQSGLATGDRLLWLGQNCHRVLECLLACAKLGAIFCPVNWRQSAEELAYVLGDARPRVVVWQSAEIGEIVQKARAAAGSDAFWLQHDIETFEDFIANGRADAPEVTVDASAPLSLIYTAAFSGRPSGALLSHTALIMQGLLTSKIRDIGPDYIYLNCGPLFHAATFMYTFATFLWAGTNVFARKMDPELICQLIDREKCTGAFLVGQTIEAIVALNRDRKYDLKSLRAMSGSPAWNEMVSRDESAGGRRPGGYGQTEMGGLLTIAALGGTGSSGRTAPIMQMRVLDANGNELPAGEVGEIVARGPLVMNGYHNRAPSGAGWHATGDLGRREADGSLTFIGPKGRLIKTGYENVYAAEVESCIKRHAAVADCMVVGVSDDKWNESVKAIIVLKPGCAADAEQIIAHCREHIASYKKPRIVEFVDAIPKR